MGERKVLNKYIPADFDPKLVPRGSKPKDDLIPVRMMLPFTVQCSTCSNFMYRGRKFNSKKEPVKGSEGKYLGIQRFRFYIKCTACSRPVTFLTDPAKGDYEMESGGTRTYEVHKDEKRFMKEVEADDEKMEKLDPMKALENRVLASQKEMADLDNLDEIKAMNMRHLKMMTAMKSNGDGSHAPSTAMDMADLVLKKVRNEDVIKEDPLELDEEDEALIKSIKFGQQPINSSNVNMSNMGAPTLIRLDQKDEEEIQRKRKLDQELLEKQQAEMLSKVQANTIVHKSKSHIVVKRKRKKTNTTDNSKITKTTNVHKETKSQEKNDDEERCNEGNALGLLGGYGSDDS